MTITEYAYTERDIYTAIVQTAVPIALTANETSLLVADLLALAETMPHDTPVGVFHALSARVLAEWKRQDECGRNYWTAYLGALKYDAARTASLDRITQQYPRLTETER